MMLKGTTPQNRIAAQNRGRAPPVVRCSAATVEPDTSAGPQPRTPRYSNAEGAAARQTRGFRRAQEGRGAEGQQRRQQQPPKQTLPSLTFLEDDPESVARRVRSLFPKLFVNGNGALVRSLGRQGAAGAVRFLLAIREEAAAAGADQCTDLLVRLNPQEPLRYFGTPLMMFVTPVRGGAAVLPAEGSEHKCKDLTVSARTEPDRLAHRLGIELNNLQAGQFLRLNMVGTEALHRGLMALNDGLGRSVAPSGSFFAVPELVTVPLRIRQQQEQQEQQQEPEHQQEQQQQQPDASAPAEAPAEAPAADEPKRVQVLRLYVGRSRGGPGRAAGQDAAAAAAAPAASDSPAKAVEGKVLVSESELAELRGALGNMVEQQKLLAQLIAERQAAVGQVAAPAAVGQVAGSTQA
ncbi:hypothetical protein PLESTB_001014900 [Pleodorina starrii]|uniref:Uncharacterized protein n=1 Tax=Pleodorina starrii TaxID=330485 RepID=A0A9W6BP77_9CHLO|nr:hypothetical protein PLESTM_001192400 [Pleodorina starrii]GLC55689.1 hypothetical protein PLESTB_001014900 [Pleodorina starrii]GLC65439.1 hypothetical protein PLESTF_000293400 [Pleodorina starrii]